MAAQIQELANHYKLWNDQDEWYVEKATGVQVANDLSDEWAHIWAGFRYKVNPGDPWSEKRIDNLSWTLTTDSGTGWVKLIGDAYMAPGDTVHIHIEWILEDDDQLIEFKWKTENDWQDLADVEQVIRNGRIDVNGAGLDCWYRFYPQTGDLIDGQLPANVSYNNITDSLQNRYKLIGNSKDIDWRWDEQFDKNGASTISDVTVNVVDTNGTYGANGYVEHVFNIGPVNAGQYIETIQHWHDAEAIYLVSLRNFEMEGTNRNYVADSGNTVDSPKWFGMCAPSSATDDRQETVDSSIDKYALKFTGTREVSKVLIHADTVSNNPRIVARLDGQAGSPGYDVAPIALGVQRDPASEGWNEVQLYGVEQSAMTGNGNESFGITSASEWAANSFQASSTFELTQLTLFIGAPSGDFPTGPITCEIYSATGSPDAPNASLGVAVPTYDPAITAFAPQTFWFNEPITLVSGTYYFIVLKVGTPSATEKYYIFSNLAGSGSYQTWDGSSWSEVDSSHEFKVIFYNDQTTHSLTDTSNYWIVCEIARIVNGGAPYYLLNTARNAGNNITSDWFVEYKEFSSSSWSLAITDQCPCVLLYGKSDAGYYNIMRYSSDTNLITGRVDPGSAYFPTIINDESTLYRTVIQVKPLDDAWKREGMDANGQTWLDESSGGAHTVWHGFETASDDTNEFLIDEGSGPAAAGSNVFVEDNQESGAHPQTSEWNGVDTNIPGTGVAPVQKGGVDSGNDYIDAWVAASHWEEAQSNTTSVGEWCSHEFWFKCVTEFSADDEVELKGFWTAGGGGVELSGLRFSYIVRRLPLLGRPVLAFIRNLIIR